MKSLFVPFLLSVAFLTAPANAAETFTLEDPKGVDAISFFLDSLLEPIMGVTQGISGEVKFDPEKPMKTTGKVTIQAEKIETPNKKMTSVLHSEDWLNVEKFGQAMFEIKEVTSAQPIGEGVFELMVVGDFTLKGVTKEIKAPVTLTHLPNRLGDRLDGKEGDLLIVRSEFTINRNDYNITKDPGGLKVAQNINIKVAITGHNFAG